MRLGILIPTTGEAGNLPQDLPWLCAGYGPGKAAACAAAAELVFARRCDTIVIWGTAGGISPLARRGHALLATRVAYSDYDLTPLTGITGPGFVPGVTDDDGWMALDPDLNRRLELAFRQTFPELPLHHAAICSSDSFLMPPRRDDYNRIEATADAIDMESAAVAEFCTASARRLGLRIRLGVLRIVSNATGTPETGRDFEQFLDGFCRLNLRLADFKNRLDDNPN